jgi:uncharacterized protein YndB with AHSA1/START domain
MAVRRAASGRRSVALEVEVQGTPAQVWEAIATGPGISSWFVRTEVEAREGGAMVFDFGPGLQSPATVTRWEPPALFGYEEREWLPGAPPVATEITVEVCAGGTCVVRFVHSLFASEDSWDDQLGSFESGWPLFFEILQARLSRFAGQPCAAVRVNRSIDMPVDDAWAALAPGLGLAGASAGDRVQSRDGAPAFAGTVRHIGGRKHHEALVDLEAPAPGLGLIQIYRWADQGSVSIALYLFGQQAAATEREERVWQPWCDRMLRPPPQLAQPVSRSASGSR